MLIYIDSIDPEPLAGIFFKLTRPSTYTLVAYHCGGQIFKGHTYTLVAYTRGGQMTKGHSYRLETYTCVGQIANG